MNPVLLGQLLAVSFACGLNLYATVAAVGLLSRFGIIHDLPAALHGLESTVVIGTALLLFVIEAIIDRVRHVDSIWDTVHTFIRPPAAALLAIGAAWAQPPALQAGAAALAFAVALGAHGAKAGFRVALNATGSTIRPAIVSTAEDVAAVGLVFAALGFPASAVAAGGGVLLALLVFGPRLWRAFALGIRCVVAWFRSLFLSPGWRDPRHMPRRLRALVGEPPLGAAAPRAARAAVHGLPGVGAFRNGWLVVDHEGPRFLFRGWIAARSVSLPDRGSAEPDAGLWVNTLTVRAESRPELTLYLLKDGPPIQVVMDELAASTV
jgi:hypothetical protein